MIRLLLLGVAPFTSLAASALAQPQEVFPDPGWHLPRVGFQQHGGGASTPIVRYPEIDGEPSAWRIVQWNRDAHLRPAQIEHSPPDAHQPELGSASWRFAMPDGSASVSIYHLDDGYAFDLRERDGDLLDIGGSNLFLSASPSLPDVTLDRHLIYAVTARVSAAGISAADPRAIGRGTVMAQIFTGFVIQSVPRPDRPTVTAFMQIPISHSGPPSVGYRHCDIRAGGTVLVYNAALSDDPMLPFRADEGPLRPLRYDLNRHFCDLLAQTFPCRRSGQAAISMTGEQLEPHNWRLISMYLGLETQARDRRPGAPAAPKAGSVSAGITVAALHVVREATGAACALRPQHDPARY